MTPNEQLELWVRGKSVHNDERDECCPDFSCCSPELLAPEHERIEDTEGDRHPPRRNVDITAANRDGTREDNTERRTT